MPQISKVERDHDIKQVSRLDDLKPATEKTVSKAIPQIRGKPEMQDTSQVLTSSMNAAKQASIAAIRHAKTISDSSDKSEDQEAIEKMEASVRNAAADSANAALGAKDALKRQIKKKSPDIKNTKDIKNGTRSIRKADRAIKSATEASQIAAKTANQAAKEATITSTKVATTRKAERLAKKSAEWVKKIVKGIVDAIKRLCAALGAASVPLMLILVLAAAIAALVASAFGIFFAGDKTNTNTRPLKEVVLEINSEYTSKIEGIKTSTPHDELVMEGYQASWTEALSVYAVYVTTKTDGAMDVVHITDDHVKILRDIFWKMNTISSSTKKVTETKKVPDLDSDGNQKKDKDGNLLYKEEKVTKTILTITINHKTASQEAEALHFNSQQKAQLNELLDVKNASLWAEILRGVGLGSSELVNLALSQLGNKGGEKYWRWAGLSKRCEWCALFVSWCGDKTGLRAAGQVPYFSFVSDGVKFYKNKGKWIDGSEVNSSNYDKLIQPGMIIFFDWEPDGKPNHVGIVTKVADGNIYTVEGNSNDAVREKQYSANSNKIYGFGVVC